MPTKVPELAQYALQAFGKALQIVPRVLAENAGYKAATTVANLQAARAAHNDEENGICNTGNEIDKEDAESKAGALNTPLMINLPSWLISIVSVLAVDTIEYYRGRICLYRGRITHRHHPPCHPHLVPTWHSIQPATFALY